MKESGKPNRLPKEVQIIYQRMPDELRRELDALPPNKIVGVLEALNKLHHAMEAGVYELAFQLIRTVR